MEVNGSQWNPMVVDGGLCGSSRKSVGDSLRNVCNKWMEVKGRDGSRWKYNM